MKFKSNIEVQAGIEDKDGQVGSSGQILASTGSQVDWIDPANIVTSATDVIIECKNTSGVTIAKGTPVYQTGNVGATAVIEVAVADASDEDKMAAIGLLQSDLINNAFGYVVVTGELLNITTSPIDGSTPAVGDTIYVKPGGGLTLTKPTGVNFIQNVGLVGKVSGGNAGSLTVSSIMRSNDVPTPLYIDHDNQRLGIGTDSPASPLHLSMTDGDIRMQSETSRNHILSRNSDDDSWRNLAISATSGQKQLVLNTAGNVGVGTNSPGAKLEVRNNDDSQTDTLLYIAQNPVTTEASVRTAWLRGESSAEAVRIDNYGSGHALIVGEGNVGIGTTSPTAKLHITKDNTTGNALLITNSGSSRSLEINHNADGAGVSDEVVRIMNNGTRLFTIESDGNVGIGTASPATKLHINEAGTSLPALYIETARYGASIIGNGTSNSQYLLNLQSNGGSTDVMRVQSSGNVGIGVTDPEKKLEVKSDTTYDGIMIDVLSAPEITFRDRGNSDTKIGTGRHQLDGFHIDTYSGNAFFIKGSNRYVGIGTTSPGAKLHVKGTSERIIIGDNSAGENWVDGQDLGGFAFRTHYDLQEKVGMYAVANLHGTGSNWSPRLEFKTAATTRLTIQSGGNVGIGTTSPTKPFQVDAGSNIASFRSVGTGQNNKELLIQTGGDRVTLDAKNADDGTATSLAFELGSSEKARLTTTGLGIGTTSPSEKLHIFNSSSSWNQYANIRMSTESDTYAAEIGFHRGTSNDSDRGLFLSGDGTNQHVKILHGGNVGIGTNTPSTRLYVDNGESTFNRGNSAGTIATFRGQNASKAVIGTAVSYFTSNVGIGTTSPAVKFQVYGSAMPATGDPASVEDLLTLYRGGSQTVWSGGASLALGRYSTGGSSAPRSRLDFKLKDAVGSNTALPETTVMTMQSNGNVGIGTTSPSSKLQVAGGIQMADDTDTASATKVGTMRYRTGTEYVEVDGVELVTNGDFATDTDWNKGANTTISGGTLNSTAIGVYVIANQSGVVSQSLYYKWTVTYTITSGGIRLGDSNNVWAGSDQTASGTYTGFVQAASTANGILYMTSQSSNFIGSVDNISVLEVTEEDASYADMCMQTGSSTYEWVNIVRNTY